METCLIHMPEVSEKEEIAGGILNNWPERISTVPPRIYKRSIEGINGETFKTDSEVWERRVSHYKRVNSQIGGFRYRNILDMNAFLGGFAAALTKDPVWVMNVVPPQSQVNTLGAIFERGLVGAYHDWLASFISLYLSACEF